MLLTCYMLSVIIIAGLIWSLGCDTVLYNRAGRIWCKMAMVVIMLAMVVIMKAMVVIMKAIVIVMMMVVVVVIMMAVVIVTPSFIDYCWHGLVHSCIVKHVHHHYFRVMWDITTTAGVWYHWHRADCTDTVIVQCMYTSIKLMCTCLLLLSCPCN